jgi:hypothetical protein
MDWLCCFKDSEGAFLFDSECFTDKENLIKLFGRPVYFSEHAPENGIELRAYR